MKLLILFFLMIVPVQLKAQDPEPLDLSEYVNAQINRIDENTLTHVFITINLTGSRTFKADFYVADEDITAFKSGSPAQKLAIGKKYIRRAMRNYLLSKPNVASPSDQGTSTVTKAQITDSGDTP